MNKKLIPFALALTMLVQTVASAASLRSYVNGKTQYSGYLDNGLFSYTKFNSVHSITPAEITPAVKAYVSLAGAGSFSAHPASAPLYGAVSSNVFDFKVELDMQNVKDTFDQIYNLTCNAFALDTSLSDTDKAALKTQLDASTIAGSFTVTVTYNPKLTFTVPASASEFDFKQNGAAPVNFEIDYANCDFSEKDNGTIKIAFNVKGNPTVLQFKDDMNRLNNLSVTLPDVTASQNNTVLSVSASLTGKTTVKDGAEEYAVLDYKSDDTDNTAAVMVRTSTGGGGNTSPITSSRVKAYTVVDGKQSAISVKSDNGTYSIDVDAITAPSKDGYTFDGWYLDAEFTTPASGTLTITEDTYLYAKFTEQTQTEPSVTVIIDGKETKHELVEEDGKYVFDIDSLEKPIKDGFVFAGWYDTPYYTNPVNGVIEVTEPVKIYSRFVNVTPPIQMISEEHIAYITGYPDGEIKPNNNITREEVVSAFYRLLKPEYRAEIETTENSFPDVENDRWSNAAISAMAKGGYIVGDSEGKFNPSKPITRAEFVTLASKFAPMSVTPVAYFSDIEDHWAKEYILSATALGWITGYDDGTFKPDNYITRAEAMTIINSMLVRYGDGNADYAVQWPDVEKSSWYYNAVIEATTYNYYSRNEDGWTETWVAESEASATSEPAAEDVVSENTETAE